MINRSPNKGMENMEKTITVQALALEATNWLQTSTRDNGENYIHPKEGCPKWVYDLIKNAHSIDDLLPNDYIYQFVEDALYLFANNQTDCYEDLICEIEADVYNSDLLKWLSSNNSFMAYIDDVIQEYGTDNKTQFSNLLMTAQQKQRQSIAENVLRSLQDELSNRE